ncbi:hypothetical protein [Amnibacterium flavum]|uniref:Uncharacterized protein n=1 Tax=Amnibacterium flavum TaxID=2173173 RepID=A0A2V1HME6_9MICO|nr:hypothetical protein [Amnibacterium flavum]PVZ93581.1 hypothetical protein DDQ50_14825 [Amnibacterium flavum]
MVGGPEIGDAAAAVLGASAPCGAEPASTTGPPVSPGPEATGAGAAVAGAAGAGTAGSGAAGAPLGDTHSLEEGAGGVASAAAVSSGRSSVGSFITARIYSRR